MILSKEKETIAFTVEKCISCNLEKKRPFKFGDVLFSDGSKCNSCEGIMHIEKIYGESIEKE